MKSILVLVFLSLAFNFNAQDKYVLRFRETSDLSFIKRIQTVFKDSVEAQEYLKELQLKAIKKGYVLASVDSLFYQKDTLNATFYLGDKFRGVNIQILEQELNCIKANSSLTERLINKTFFSPKEISKLLEDILAIYQRTGYPFCQVYLDSVAIEERVLEAKLVVKRLKHTVIRKLNLVGEPAISKKLISSYIQIKEGDVFNQQKINEISGKLKLISFISEIKPVEILFTEDGAELFLYLKTKPVSLINGIVGLQPDPVKNKLFLTGEIRLKLVNTLKRAELVDVNWRSIQQQTSSFKVQLNLPSLFQSPFGVDGQFQLYKRDSTFLEVKSTLALQYALRQGNYIRMLYRRNSSNVLSSGLNNPAFTNLNSVETNFYGLAFLKQNVDYLPNPRKGLVLSVEGTVGSRTVKSDSLPVVSTTFKGELQLNYYFPLGKRHVLRFANFTEVYLAPTYYQNEVYRFGGQISLRGFNEEELYATSRSVSTIEYRFLLDRNSYLFAFYDQGWYENKATKFQADNPFGFGLGLAFGTAIGNFSVSYALGSQQGNPLLLRDGKVHFGYIAYF